MTQEEYREQIDRACIFASGRPDAWSRLFMLALDLYFLELVFEQPDFAKSDGLDFQAPLPPASDGDPYDYPCWIVRKGR